MKAVILERKIKGKIHRTELHEECRLHIDIIEKLFNRALRRNIVIDIDQLIDTLKETK